MLVHRILLVLALVAAGVLGVLVSGIAGWVPLAALLVGWAVWAAVDQQVRTVSSRPHPRSPADGPLR